MLHKLMGVIDNILWNFQISSLLKLNDTIYREPIF